MSPFHRICNKIGIETRLSAPHRFAFERLPDWQKATIQTLEAGDAGAFETVARRHRHKRIEFEPHELTSRPIRSPERPIRTLLI